MNCFNYKGYQGSVEASIEDQCLYGKLLNISDLILYEGDTLVELEQSFKVSVDDYIEYCMQQNLPPQTPCQDSPNIQIGRDLYERASKKAKAIGKPLDDYIKEVVQRDIESHASGWPQQP